MKSLITFLLFVFISDVSYSQSSPPQNKLRTNTTSQGNQRSDNTTYYVCTGEGAYRYHVNRECGGLNNCRSSIVSTTSQVSAINDYKINNKEKTPCLKCCY